MPAPKRRKVSAATAKNASSSTGKPRGLDAFTKVSKQTATSKEIVEKTVTSSPDVKAEPVENSDSGARKRRQAEKSEEDASTSAAPVSDKLSIKHRSIRPLPVTRRSNLSQRVPETPKKPVSPPTPTPIEETPSKEACGLFSRFDLAKSSPTQFDSSPLRQEDTSIFDGFEDIKSSQVSVEAGLPDVEEEKESLPTELLDLINLHASFLNALSLHYAHNGTHTPADLRELCPAIALSWGKRSVTLEDIRRALGVQNFKDLNNPTSSQPRRSSILTLSNYGGNKICIEISSVFGKKGVMARPLDEHHTNAQYTSNLINLWKTHCQTESSSGLNTEPDSTSSKIATFISNLPLEPIQACLSLDKISPTLAKGQRRLQDLKASLTQKKQSSLSSKTALRTTPSSSNTDESSTKAKRESPLKRSSSLLDRIKAKQAHALTLPPPPTKASQTRTAALHRLEEVISILTLLSTAGSAGQQRVSFTLSTVLGKLKDSMRNSISVEEGRRCLEVLVGEVAPEWVRLVGGVGGKGGAVVFDRERRVGNEEVKRRIEGALERGGD